MNVLVLDSDTDYLQTMEKLLLEENYHVVTATTIEEGLKVAKGLKNAIILTNFIFNGANKITAIKNLMDLKYNLKMIIISENRSVNFKKAGFKSNYCGFFAKPFDFSELLAKISNL